MDIREAKVKSVPDLSTTHPSGDKRFKLLDVAMKRQLYQPDSLIEVLHKAQDLFGYLEHDVLFYIARGLRLPPSRVYGVATFYHLFSLKPQGAHSCVVCMGTACFVNDADQILAAAEEYAHIKAGEMTADKQLSLLTARCIGACGIAPIVVYDGETAGKQSPKELIKHLMEWLPYGS